MGSAQRLVIEAIKDYMKRNAGKPVPGFRELTAKIRDIPESYYYAYSNLKKQAFKELKTEGYVLKYTNEQQTIAIVDGYNPPPGSAEKVASKMLGLSGDEDPGMECFDPSEPAQQPPIDPKPEKKKPPFLLYINQTGLKAKDCDSIGKLIQGVAGMPGNITVDIQIRVRTKAKG